MKRPLLLAGIAAFVVVDVLLVVLAVGSVRSDDGTPADNAADAGTTDAGTTDAGTTDVGTTGTPAGPSTLVPSPNGPAEPTPRTPTMPPVHLDAGNDGTLMRATRGDCERGNARVEISTDGGRTFETVTSPVTEVLRVEVSSSVDMWLVGLDESCTAGFYRSDNTGRSWEAAAGTAGAWHVLDNEAPALHAPDGRVPVGCVPESVASVDFDVAYVGCEDDALRVTRDGGQTWRRAGAVPGLVSTSFRSRDTGFAVAVGEECAAQVWRTTGSGGDWVQRTCLQGDLPARGVAASGDSVYVQQGPDLLSSDDDGRTFTLVD